MTTPGQRRFLGSFATIGSLCAVLLASLGLLYGVSGVGSAAGMERLAIVAGGFVLMLTMSVTGLLVAGPATCVAFIMALLSAPTRFERRFLLALLPMIPPVGALLLVSLVSAWSWEEFWVCNASTSIYFYLAASAGFLFLGTATAVVDRLRENLPFVLSIMLVEGLFCSSCLFVICLLGARGLYF
ncbi:MAG: hypothetical protein AB7W16_00350 [Candidatus Obscuribacterales bacterium]